MKYEVQGSLETFKIRRTDLLNFLGTQASINR